MAIVFQCDACQKQLRARDEQAGRQVRCSQCGQVLSIPSAPASARPPTAAVPASPEPPSTGLPAPPRPTPVASAPDPRLAPAKPPRKPPVAVPVAPEVSPGPQVVPTAPADSHSVAARTHGRPQKTPIWIWLVGAGAVVAVLLVVVVAVIVASSYRRGVASGGDGGAANDGGSGGGGGGGGGGGSGGRITVGRPVPRPTPVAFRGANHLRTIVAEDVSVIDRFVFAPDGKTIVSTVILPDYRERIVVWDVSTGRPLHTLMGQRLKDRTKPETQQNGIAVSPDGTLIAAVGQQGEAWLWEASTGRPLATWRAHKLSASCCEFAPDGKILATGSRYYETHDNGKYQTISEVTLWDVATQRPLRTMMTGRKGTISLCFSPDGQRLAVGEDLGHIQMWDPQTGQRVWASDAGIGHHIVFAPDSKSVLCEYGGHVRYLHASDGTVEREFKSDSSLTIKGFAISPDGKTIVAGHGLGVNVWYAELGREQMVNLEGNEKLAGIVAFSPDGRLLALGGGTGGDRGHKEVKSIRLYRVDEETSGGIGVAHFDIPQERATVGSLAFSPQGERLAVGLMKGAIYLFDLQTCEPIQTFHGHTGFVTHLAFSPDGRQLASGSHDKTLAVWDVESGGRQCVVEQDYVFRGVNASLRDGKLLTFGGALEVRDWATGTIQRVIDPGDHWGFKDLQCATRGNVLAAVHNKSVKTYGLDGQPTAVIDTGPTDVIALSPSGDMLAVGASRGPLRLWSLPDGQPAGQLEMKGITAIRGLVFSADGRFLVSAILTGVQVWDVRGRRLAREFKGADYQANHLAASPVGRHVAIDNQKRIRILALPSAGEGD